MPTTSQHRPRSTTHGTCALNGHHTNLLYAKECPVLRRAARQAAKASRNTLIRGDQGGSSGSSPEAPETAQPDAGLNGMFRDTGGAPEDPAEPPLAHRRRPVGRRPSTTPSRHGRYRRRTAARMTDAERSEYLRRAADRARTSRARRQVAGADDRVNSAPP